MNPIRTATGLVSLPAHAAAAVAGTAVGVTTTAARAVARAVTWTASRVAAPPPQPAVVVRPDVPEQPQPHQRPASPQPPVGTPAPPAARTSARRAPSRQAAVVAPALGLTEAEAEDVLGREADPRED